MPDPTDNAAQAAPADPTFERAANCTIELTRAIYSQRGEEYSDTWALPNFSTAVVRATLKRFGVEFTDEQIRLLDLAALIDVKDSRLLGAWNPDSMYDGIAYRAAYTTLRAEYEAQRCD